MRFSAIEIGTNSTKFIIVELTESGVINVIKKNSSANRLSNGMYLENNLKLFAIGRAMDIIGDLIVESKIQRAPLVSIFSTSVLRDAGNKQILLRRVKEKYGFDIEIISGEYEAYFAYLACKQIVENKEERFVAIDIGGGSTEITIGSGESIEQKVSLDIGAVRLTEMFVKHDPISNSEVKEISNYVERKIAEIEPINLSGLQLVGTGGTIKSLGTISAKEKYNYESKINGKILSICDVERLFQTLSQLNIDSKINLIGLNPKRADVITAGVIILLTTMRKFRIEELKISAKGVLEGFITDYIQTHAV